MKSSRFTRFIIRFLFLLVIVSVLGCYHYRVLNTNNDPSTEYEKKVLWSYAWGLINKPKDFHIPNCDNSNAIDEVEFSKKFGQSLLTVITLGIVSPVEVRWKCHKPCPPADGGL
jgi:hypothetical protein